MIAANFVEIGVDVSRPERVEVALLSVSATT
jgi:hypothetical protein